MATVFVTGYSGRQSTGNDYATIADRATTGRQTWASRYHSFANSGGACCVAVSPAGRTVFVTGWSQGRTSYDYALPELRRPALPNGAIRPWPAGPPRC